MPDLRALIARCRELEQAATPGPWYGSEEAVITGDGDRVCCNDCLAADPDDVDADMRAISTSRNLFAALLDVAEAADALFNACATDAPTGMRQKHAATALDRLAAAMEREVGRG